MHLNKFMLAICRIIYQDCLVANGDRFLKLARKLLEWQIVRQMVHI